MCGIFGHSNVAPSQLDHAHTALHTLAHRGPNGWSHAHTNNVYLGHRRLSIQDLSANGTQPMESQGVYLTANGEIYNFQELREELKQKHGAVFRSGSDSEVLLHGYIHWGMDTLLNRIDGMLAMALYDSNSGKIYLARDHAGIKPMYYSTYADNTGTTTLGWASELQALTTFHAPQGLEHDMTAVYDFLTYLCIPAPKSLYLNIRKLEAAHVLTFDITTGSTETRRYWSLSTPRTITDDTEARQKIRQAIGTSVDEQLVADVTVGTFLSGGVDSSIISYEAAQRVPQITTCSISFSDPEVDETRYANMVAEQLGTRHITREVSQNLVNEKFEMLRDLFQEPFGDASAFPTYQVCQLASENMTVVLTGDGGDELFGGYRHYGQWFMQYTPWLGFLFPLRGLVSKIKNTAAPQSFVHKLARKLEVFTIVNPLERHVRLRGCLLKSDAFKCRFRQAFSIPEDYDDLWYLRPHYRADLPLKSRAMYLDFHTLMTDSILTKVDRTSMAVAIETRVPLLSKRMCETAWQLAETAIFADGELKGILKAMYADKLPRACLYRKKQGFSIGKAEGADKLALHGKSLPEVLLERLFPELLPGAQPQTGKQAPARHAA